MPGGGGGMSKFRIDRRITLHVDVCSPNCNEPEQEPWLQGGSSGDQTIHIDVS